jgi:hypothetical protein
MTIGRNTMRAKMRGPRRRQIGIKALGQLARSPL